MEHYLTETSRSPGRYIRERLWLNGEYPEDYYDAIEAEARALVAEHGPTPAIGCKVFALSFGSFHGENLWDDLGGTSSDFCHDPNIPFGTPALPAWCASVETCNAMLKAACAGHGAKMIYIEDDHQDRDDDEPETLEEVHARRRAEMRAKGPDAYRQFLHEEIERAAFNIKLGLLTGDEPWQVAARARLRADVRELNAL